MSVNKFKPHAYVIPEDDANSKLANGFYIEIENQRQIQIMPEAGGWSNVCEIFLAEYVAKMHKNPDTHVVLLVDFDDQPDRPDKIKERIPEDLRPRVFVLGTKGEPEDLKKAGLGSLEDIGRILGKECRDGIRNMWSHDQLKQNENELDRLANAVRDFLF